MGRARNPKNWHPARLVDGGIRDNFKKLHRAVWRSYGLELLEGRFLLSAITVNGTSGNDAWYARDDATGDSIQLWLNSTPAQSSIPTLAYPRYDTDLLTINAGAGDDSLTIDLVNGSPFRSGALVFNGDAGMDTLSIVGRGSPSTSTGVYSPALTAGYGSLLTGSKLMSYSGLDAMVAHNFASFSLASSGSIDSLSIDSPASGQNRVSGTSNSIAITPLTLYDTADFTLDLAKNDTLGGANGNDALNISANGMIASGLGTLHVLAGSGANTLTVSGGSTNLDTGAGIGGGNLSVTLNNSAIVNLTTTQYIHALTLNGSSQVRMPSDLFKVLLTDTLSVPGAGAKLDLGNNDMIVHNGDIAALTALLQRGRGNAASPWQGTGITSSTAAADPDRLTAVGVVRNNQYSVSQGSFDGKPITGTDVLLKFTYAGDADLSGTVDASDYFQIDHGYVQHLTGWFNGDFDFSSSVDVSDYFYIDVNFGAYAAQTVPAFVISGASSANEGAVYTLNISASALRTYFDPVLQDDVTGVINPINRWSVYWGDGTASAYTAGLAATHVYADDSGAGSYSITVFATETATYFAGMKTVQINNVAPVLSLTGNSTAIEGAPYGLRLTSSDPGADTITSWTVNWGDGSAIDNFADDPGLRTHAFASGVSNATVVVSAFDEDGGPYITSKTVGVAPKSPDALTAAVASSSQVNLSWSDNSVLETGYKIERTPLNTIAWTQIAAVGANASSFSDTGLAEATLYAYRVKAYDVAGGSAYADAASAKTLNQTPSVAAMASATPATVTGNSSVLTALGAASLGESQLTYTWWIVSKPAGGADPTFSVNGSNAAKTSTATFWNSGVYTFRVLIANSEASITSDVSVTVSQTLSSVSVDPGVAEANYGDYVQFGAVGRDQFGQAMVSQPVFTWALVTGAGSINSSGLYTAPAFGDAASPIVRATSGSVYGSAAVALNERAFINFDDLPASTTVTSQYGTAIFSSDAGYTNQVIDTYGATHNHVLGTGPSPTYWNHNLYADFPRPVNSLQFHWATAVGSGVVGHVRVFQQGTLTATLDINGAGYPGLIDLTAYSDVTRVELLPTGSNSFWWDDFSYCLAPPDLDIDSDNTNGLTTPDRNGAEENLEGDPATTGKYIGVNDDDGDGDGLPDFADGFNLDAIPNSSDDAANDHFVPMVLELPGGVNFSQTKIKFEYDGSDPIGVIRDMSSEGAIYAPATGSLRLWRKDGSVSRNKLSVGQGGDYLKPDEAYAASQLGFSTSNRITTVWVEAMPNGLRSAQQSIGIFLDADGDANGASYSSSDVVRLYITPEVSIEATDPDALEQRDPDHGATQPDSATFTVSRSGSLDTPLTVFYTVAGSAHMGSDFATLPGSITIPSGAASAQFSVTPIYDGIDEDEFESVDISLAHDPSHPWTYTIAALAGDEAGTLSGTSVAVSASPRVKSGEAEASIADRPGLIDRTILSSVVYPDFYPVTTGSDQLGYITREYALINGKAYLASQVTLSNADQFDTIVNQQTTAGRVIDQSDYAQIRASLLQSNPVTMIVPSTVEEPQITAMILAERSSVGAPGRWESLIPFWGSARSAVYDFQTGHWVWGIVNTGMAISDLFLIKSVLTAGAKAIFKVPISAAENAARQAIVEQVAQNLSHMTSAEAAIAQIAEEGAELTTDAARAARKAEKWAEYQSRTAQGQTSNWSYERWSTVYDVNQTQALRHGAKADAYQVQLGWGNREVTVDAGGVSRRLDIADTIGKRAVEYKTGYQTATRTGPSGVGGNLWEIERDHYLKANQGWNIKWVFEDRPSQPLLNELDQAGIPAFDTLGNPLNISAGSAP